MNSSDRRPMGIFTKAAIGFSFFVLAPFGHALDLAQHRGQVVLLDFWASWCAPCLRSFPWMDDMQAKYAGQGLVVIAVNLDDEREAADSFLRTNPVRFQTLFDHGPELARQYDVQAMPTSFLIDRAGQVVEEHLGFKVRAQADYEQAIVRMLNHNIEMKK